MFRRGWIRRSLFRRDILGVFEGGVADAAGCAREERAGSGGLAVSSIISLANPSLGDRGWYLCDSLLLIDLPLLKPRQLLTRRAENRIRRTDVVPGLLVAVVLLCDLLLKCALTALSVLCSSQGVLRFLVGLRLGGGHLRVGVAVGERGGHDV